MTVGGAPVAAGVTAALPGRRLTRHLRGLPRPFWYLWAGTLFNRVGSFVVPFLALYLTGSRGVTVGEAGLVLSVLGLGSAVSQPVGGVLADRIGRRRTIVLGLVSSAAALLVLGAAEGLPAIGAAALAYGLCLDLMRPAVQAAIADLVLGALVASIAPVHLRGRYLGVFGMSFGVAATLAPLVATQVLDRFGEPALWGGSFVLCAVAGVGLLLVSAAAQRRTPEVAG